MEKENLIDLKHQAMTDRFSDNCTQLENNWIRNKGADAIGTALTKNKTLRILR